MTLDELRVGEIAVIREIDTRPDTKRRLLDIGLARGTELEVLRFAPFGDPVEISLKDFSLALRISDAKKITVERISREKTDGVSEIAAARKIGRRERRASARRRGEK